DGITSFYDPKEAEESLKQAAPVSGEHFKTELKSLAQGLNEFAPTGEIVRSHEAQKTQSIDNFNNQRRHLSENRGAHVSGPSQRPQTNAQMPMQTQPQTHQPQSASQPTLPPHVQRQRLENTASMPGPTSSVTASNRAQGSSVSGLAALLDANSQLRVAQVRESMNLSSDNEALRMLISLGFDRLKSILPVD
ncbi:MAG: hypothetical protein AAF202_13475, partial [Pseudomonadota bacterium]